jgi:hypothetical protein
MRLRNRSSSRCTAFKSASRCAGLRRHSSDASVSRGVSTG